MTPYLVDTNLLVSLIDLRRPQHSTARHAVEMLRRQGLELAIAPQNCVEFWNVATRPATKNGLGFSPNIADQQLSRIERGFIVLPDSPAVYPIWRRLVVNFAVSGVQVHDARLVASIQAHGIRHILTFNISDFARYASTGIVVIDPATI